MARALVRMFGLLVVGLLVVALPLRSAKAADERYFRVSESDDGSRIRLELSVRTLGREGGPDVKLAGAVHIGDLSYYESLQRMLDAQDVVLYEGVKPAGLGLLSPEASDAQRTKATKNRLRLLAAGAERHRIEHGTYPRSIGEMADAAGDKMGVFLREASVDGWGTEVGYQVADLPATFDFVSAGPDAARGGDASDDDLKFSDQDPLGDEATEDAEGIQTQLADALGLEFQLDAMRHDGPNWRNADLSIDEIGALLGGGGGEPNALFALLDGSSISAKLAGFMLKMIGMSETMSTMTKVMLVEMLAHADEILEGQLEGMDDFMRVIIDERNKVVVRMLGEIIQGEPGVRSVGIIYGGGHLPDLEERLTDEFGYAFVSDEWLPAITIDLDQAGIPPAQMRQMRKMMSRMMEQQLKSLKK